VSTATPRTKARKRPLRGRVNLRNYFDRANLLTSVVLVFPLFLLYQLAVIALPNEVGNGADLITGRLIALLGGSRLNYLALDGAMLAAFVIAVALLRRKQRFDVRLFVPVVLESGVYALTMGAAIVYVMGLLGINPALAVGGAKPGVLVRIALSLGAGVNEELVFRLMMLPALALFFEKLVGMRRALAVAGAFVVSSLLFSAAHHVIGGEPWRLGAFTYRFFCGLIFASLFQFRGFAVAVYTHALYDIYVMLFG
jgi:hypothetical protein